MEFALKSEIYCFIHLHSLLRIVFVHNIYYIFANLSLANKTNIRFSNKTWYIADIGADIPPARETSQKETQKFKNNHFVFLKNIELRW